MPVTPPSAAAGAVSAETPGTAPGKVIVMARVAIKPTEPEPPADEDQAEAGPKLRLKSKEPPLFTMPVPASGERTPVGTSASRWPSSPSISAPASVVELPPLLSSVARTRPPRFEVDPVALVVSIVGLLVFSGVVYFTYQKYVVGAAWTIRRPETAPGSATAINPKVSPGPSASTQAPPALAPADPRFTRRPAPTGRSSRFHIFVDQLKVGGIRVGPPPRLFVEGLTYLPGDVVDQRLGIIFVGLDVTNKEIVFRDDTGTEIRRRY